MAFHWRRWCERIAAFAVTTLLLVRHAVHDLVGRALVGRNEAVHLNEAGRRQAQALARRLGGPTLAAVFTSPQSRAQETARPIARFSGLDVQVENDLDEIDFGQWTGKTFQELASDPHWETWVNRRSIAKPPKGEAFAQVRVRVIECLARLTAAHPDGAIVVVSHGDVLKAALAHYLRSSLDDLERFDIAPASISIVAAGTDWTQVRLVNRPIDDQG
jgi:broad specificity phosphatase PhoE